MIGLLEKFDRWDYNGNGQLEKSELKEAEQIGGFASDEIISFYDTDSSGGISFAEAQSGLSRVDEAKKITEKLGQ
jgi:Ca2+-binding EF-hand superfamily protein